MKAAPLLRRPVRSDSGDPRPRILIFAPSFPPAVDAGGPARALDNLVRASAQHVRIEVCTPDRDLGAQAVFPDALSGPVDYMGAVVHYINVRSFADWWRFYRRVAGTYYDAILLNSVWNRPFSIVPALMKLLGIIECGTLILMPRGELESGALQLKRIRKAIALPAVRRLYRCTVDVFGSTSESESANTRTLVPDARVLLTDDCPDRVPFGVPSSPDSRAAFLFLGRVHPTKGLLQALNGMKRLSRPATLSIAGPIADSTYWDVCSRVVDELPPYLEVKYLGTVPRPAIPALLHDHDALINLTAGENFGHTFAEAMQAGCQVIATAASPWTQVLRGGGGLVVDDRDDPAAVAGALEKVACCTAECRQQARSAARHAYDLWDVSRPPNILQLLFGFPMNDCSPGHGRIE